VPSGLNLLTDRRIRKPFVLQFGAPERIPSQPWALFVSDAELLTLRNILSCVDIFRCVSEGLKNTVVLREDPILRCYLGEDDALYAHLDQLLVRLRPWYAALCDEPLDAGPENDRRILYSFLFTWYPLVTSHVEGRQQPQLALAVPFSDEGLSGAWATVGAVCGVSAGDELPVEAIAAQLQALFAPLLRRTLAIEANILGRHRPQFDLELERTIRSLQYITKRSVEDADKWSTWRAKWPKPASGQDLRRWDIPMWGASEAMLELFRSLETLLAKDVAKAGNRGGVTTVFLYSPPGCGKENIARLCHYLSPRCCNAEVVTNCYKRLKGELGSARVLHNLGKRPLTLFSETVNDITSWCDSLGDRAADAPWDFNYFVAQGGELSGRGVLEELIGRGSEQDFIPGALLRAACCGGTVFLDEFNTLTDRDANLLLRPLEDPYQIEIRELPATVHLNVLLVLGSNKRPEELIAQGWNEAVLSRVAKPGQYFEIPPLRDRRVDIAVATAYYLETQEQRWKDPSGAGQVDLFEVDAFRFLCSLDLAEGNYRQLVPLLAELYERHRKKWATSPSARRITFQDLFSCVAKGRVSR